MSARASSTHLVPAFEHRPGIHCGSTAMADALRTVGIDLSEPMALGLGAGPYFLMFEGRGLSPGCFFLGRSITFEQDLCSRLHVPFEERNVASFDEAWAEMRRLVDEGKAVLLLSDVRYLPHYETTTHFNGHRVVLAGYDDARGMALLADSHFPGLVEVPLAAFREAVMSDAPPVTTTDTIFGHLAPPARPFDLAEAAPKAVRACAEAQLEEGGFVGVGGIESLARKLPGWARADDGKWRARFGYQVIERRGCGGGLFRRMYADFLRECGDRLSDGRFQQTATLSANAAEAWSRLALELRRASEASEPAFDHAAELAATVAITERTLWETARDLFPAGT